MYAYLKNNGYGCCGVVMLGDFKKPEIVKNYWGETITYSSITLKDLMKQPGSRLVQAGFILGDSLSDEMFEYLTTTLRLIPSYISPVRPNTNMSEKHPFYTVIFELPERT